MASRRWALIAAVGGALASAPIHAEATRGPITPAASLSVTASLRADAALQSPSGQFEEEGFPVAYLLIAIAIGVAGYFILFESGDGDDSASV